MLRSACGISYDQVTGVGSDVPHRAVLRYVADLPLGRALLSNVPVLSSVLGGWKAFFIATSSQGLPLSITGGAFPTSGP